VSRNATSEMSLAPGARRMIWDGSEVSARHSALDLGDLRSWSPPRTVVG
jgi:hypothetical protein